MKLTDVETYLKRIDSELFSFSFALLPDDLQAQQVVIDSLGILFVEKDQLLDQVISSKEDDELNEQRDNNDNHVCHYEQHDIRSQKVLNDIKVFLFKSAYCLCVKRFMQIKNSLKMDGMFIPFFNLELKEKAILYLKFKTPFLNSEIQEILGVDEVAFVSGLNNAKLKLAQNSGVDITHI